MSFVSNAGLLYDIIDDVAYKNTMQFDLIYAYSTILQN